jgi:hypothetical protein
MLDWHFGGGRVATPTPTPLHMTAVTAKKLVCIFMALQAQATNTPNIGTSMLGADQAQ